jgi:hypothetical protein
MATNNLNGVNWTQIARDAIEFYGSEFFPINLFATNLSDQISTKGESVTTRIITGYSSQDVSSGYSGAAQNSVSTAVTTTLSNFKGLPVEFKDIELTKAGDPEWLKQHFFIPTRDATMKALADDLLALITNANYSNKSTIAVGSFDGDSLADIRGELTKRKVPREGRSILLDPDYYTALLKDTSFSDASASRNQAVIRDGVLERARGMNVYEYESIPGNSENLEGFALSKSALVVAARPMANPGDRQVTVANLVEPNTGIPFQFRVWYSPNKGVCYMSAGFLYGVSVGQAAALQRIVSA